MNKESNTAGTAIDANRLLTKDFSPVNNPKSVCFECDAGMCSECSSKHEWDLWRKHNSDLFEKQEETSVEILAEKNEFKCPKCGWTPNWNGRSLPKVTDFYVGGGDYRCQNCFSEFKFSYNA